jgi:hypothetical protein
MTESLVEKLEIVRLFVISHPTHKHAANCLSALNDIKVEMIRQHQGKQEWPEGWLEDGFEKFEKSFTKGLAQRGFVLEENEVKEPAAIGAMPFGAVARDIEKTREEAARPAKEERVRVLSAPASTDTLNEEAWQIAMDAYEAKFPDAQGVDYAGLQAGVRAYLAALPSEIRLLNQVLDATSKYGIADNITIEGRSKSDVVQDVWDELVQRGLIGEPKQGWERREWLYAYRQTIKQDGANRHFISLSTNPETTLREAECLGRLMLNSIEDGSSHE